jgi:uncharacterized protein YqgC (DUF456 family)
MVYFWLILLLLLNLCWWVLVFFYLPGNWLIILSTAAFAWWRWDDGVFSIWTLVFITVLGIIGEIIEFFSGMAGAKSAGAGWKGAFAAILGAIIGAIVGTMVIPIPFLGTLLGAAGGAGLATWLIEHSGGKKANESVRSGVGAGLGVFLGTGAKVVIGALIWLIVAVAAFWP